MRRTILILAVAFLVSGCAFGSFQRARGALDAGDHRRAALAAGENPAALREVSLAILVGGLEVPETRVVAARGLLAAGVEARAVLLRAVESPDVVVSAVAASILVEQGEGDDRLEGLLRERLISDQVEARIAATRALGLWAREEGFFRDRLTDLDSGVRLAAIDALGGNADQAMVRRLLIEIAGSDDEPRVRVRALRALARVGGSTDEELLLAEQMLERPLVTARLAAVDALAHRFDQAEAQQMLRRIAGSGDGVVALRAGLELARHGERSALTILEVALIDGSTTQAATVAIGSAGLSDLQTALLRALERDEPEVRLNAAAALMGTAHRDRAGEALRGLLDQPGWIGVQAAFSLARGDDDDGMARLDRALSDPDEGLRVQAASALGLLPAGLALARRALADEAPRVRVAAAWVVMGLLRRA
jgi:HEAT repeat protein